MGEEWKENTVYAPKQWEFFSLTKYRNYLAFSKVYLNKDFCIR